MEEYETERLEKFGKKYFRLFFFVFIILGISFIGSFILMILDNLDLYFAPNIIKYFIGIVLLISFFIGTFLLLSGKILASTLQSKDIKIINVTYLIGIIFSIFLMFILLIIIIFFYNWWNDWENQFGILILFSILFSISLSFIIPKAIFKYHILKKYNP